MIFRVIKLCKCLGQTFSNGHEFAEGDLPRDVAERLLAAGEVEAIGNSDEIAAEGKKPHRFATLSADVRKLHGL